MLSGLVEPPASCRCSFAMAGHVSWGTLRKAVTTAGVELNTGTLADDFAACLEGGGAAVRPVRGDGIERVGDSENTGAGEDFITFQATGIAAAVVALVMGQDDFSGIGKKGNIRNQIEAYLHVALHENSFVVGKWPWLEKDAVGDSELSNIVQIGSSGQATQLVLGPTQDPGELEGVAADTPRVACGFVVAEVDRRAKSLEGVCVAALGLGKSFAELNGAAGNHVFEVLTVVFELPFEVMLMEGVFETGKDGVFVKRFDEVVVCSRAHGLDTHIDVVHTSRDEECDVRIGTADMSEKLHTAKARHLQVGDDGIEALMLQSGKGVFAGGGGSAVEAGGPEHQGEKFAGSALVVDGKNADDRGMGRRVGGVGG